MRRARYQRGSVVRNKRSKTWHYLWCENGRRRSRKIGTFREIATKAEAWRVAENFRTEVRPESENARVITVTELVKQYESEKLPLRANTARVYRAWLHNHVIPYWGGRPLTDVQPRETELWLRQLDLSSKSKAHVRNIIRTILEYAMWAGLMDFRRNPMSLVRVEGATQRVRQPRSLTVEEFGKLAEQLSDPFRTMAVVAVCFGLRVSELLALRWSDVDWLNSTLKIERRIVAQQVDNVKTSGSRRKFKIDASLLEVFKRWRQTTQFADEADWIFASPMQLGRLPYTDSGFWRVLNDASTEAGIGRIGTHTFRHTFRSWLDAVGTAIAVQQKMMRHADIGTTMNIYGDVVTDEMALAHTKVVGLALGRDRELIAEVIAASVSH